MHHLLYTLLSLFAVHIGNSQAYFQTYTNNDSSGNQLFELARSLYSQGDRLFSIGNARLPNIDSPVARIKEFNVASGNLTVDRNYANEILGRSQIDDICVIDTNYYFTGTHHFGGSTFGYDVIVGCIGLDGQYRWHRILGDSGRFERAYDIESDVEGNLYVAALRNYNIGPSSTGCVVHKMTTEGEVIWSKIVSGADFKTPYDLAVSIAVDSMSNSYLLATKPREMSIAKIDSSGRIVWTKDYPIDQLSTGHHIIIDKDHNLLVAGDARLDKYLGAPVCFYMSLDLDGNVLWMRDYQKYVGNRFYQSKLCMTKDGGIARVFDSFGYPTLLVVNSDGSYRHHSEYTAFDLYLSVTEDLVELDDGSFVMLGYLPANNNLNKDKVTMWLLRTDANGDFVSVDHYEDPIDRLEIYPNPALDYVTVATSRDTKNMSIQIFNQQGQKVMTARFGQVDMSNLISGVYYFSIFEGNQWLGTRKVVKQ